MTPLTPLYTSSFLLEAPNLPGHGTPVVRYSDHCAQVAALQEAQAKLLASVEMLTAECERLQARLNTSPIVPSTGPVATGDQTMAPLGTPSTVADYHENKPLDEFIGRVAQGPGRWNEKGQGKPKAL